MAIGDNFKIDYIDKKVYWSGAVSYPAGEAYTTNELYSYLQDTFDELGQLDDDVPMSAQTPTAYTMINSWFIDNESVKHLSGGAIQTSNWEPSGNDEGIRVLSFAAGGYSAPADAQTGLAVTGDTTSDSGKLLAFDNTLRKWWIRIDASGDEFDNASEEVGIAGGYGGTLDAVSTGGEDLWANIYTLGTIEGGTNVYIYQSGSKISAWWPAGHLDALIKVKESNNEISGAKIVVLARQYSKLYDHFDIDLTPGGRNAVPLATSDDLDNATPQSGVSGGDSTTITFGDAGGKDLNNGNGTRPYNCIIDCATSGLAGVYEYLKWVTFRTASGDVSGVSGERYLGVDPDWTPVKAAPFGRFAGGKFFAARGVWITNYASSDAKNFQLIDSSGVTQDPPNTVTVRVSSVVSGDRVAVYKLTATGGIWFNEYLGQSGNVSGQNTLDIQGTNGISGDVPYAGKLIVSGVQYDYASYSSNTFTLSGADSGLLADYDTGSFVYVPLVSEQTATGYSENTLTYSTNIPILVRVRKKGILPFEVESTVTTAGATVAAIRTTDSIVT